MNIHLESEQQFPDIHVTKPASFSVLQPTTTGDHEHDSSHDSSVVGSLESTPSFAQVYLVN